MPRLAMVPETNNFDLSERIRAAPIDRERTISHFPTKCCKRERHHQYKRFDSLTVHDLPPGWQSDSTLRAIKQLIGRRVVHITLLRKSSQRRDKDLYLPQSEGSGFLIFDHKLGPLVHTSKHVIRNPEEADCAVIRLFHEDDTKTKEAHEWMTLIHEKLNETSLQDRSEPNFKSNKELYIYLPDTKRYFRSVSSMDYTCFAVDMAVQDRFTKDEINNSNRAFHWWQASLKRVRSGSQMELDVCIISHPHGMPKCFAFGKIEYLADIGQILYSTLTCPGSSGAPVIRLDKGRLLPITAGQYVHHGYWQYQVKMGICTIKPPITLPYLSFLDKKDVSPILKSFEDLIYEPVGFWAEFICDFLHLDTLAKMTSDVIVDVISLILIIFGGTSVLFQLMMVVFCLHLSLLVVLRVMLYGWSVKQSVLEPVGYLIRMSMFPVGWLLRLLAPAPLDHLLFVVPVCLAVAGVERYKNYSFKFHQWSVGGDTSKFVRSRLQQEEEKWGEMKQVEAR